ncbi:MAG: type II secretion system protein [Pseudomonadota bacterium]
MDRRRGMTLLEVLIALMIVAIVIGGVAISAGSVFSSRLGQTSGKLMATIRYAFDRAVMTGKTYQLVVDLDEGAFWLEEMEKEKSCETRLREIDDLEKGKAGQAEAEASVETLLKGQKKEDMIVRTSKLPDGIKIEAVMAQHHQEPVTSGQARILFFPEGISEKAFIWLSMGETVHTVEIRALQGRGVQHREELSARDLEKR